MNHFTCQDCGAPVEIDEDGNYLEGCIHFPVPNKTAGRFKPPYKEPLKRQYPWPSEEYFDE